MKFCYAAPSLLLILATFILPALAQGGKADPLRLRFARGASGAMVQGQLRGDREYEYVFRAKKGQWLRVELTATPREAAVFQLTAPRRKALPPRYEWSGVLPESGDYLLSVSTPADYGRAKFALTVSVLAHAPPAKTTNDPGTAALQRSMDQLITALRNKDRAAFLSLFSRSRPYYHLNPQNLGSRRQYRRAVFYPQLAADVEQQTGLYWTYLERGEHGSQYALVDSVPNLRTWIRVQEQRFVPPGSDGNSLTYVEWRKEGDRWVIAAISYPQS